MSASAVGMPRSGNSCNRSIAAQIEASALPAGRHRDCSDRENSANARRLQRRRVRTGSSNFARRGTWKFVRRTPACYPGLHVVERDGGTCLFEGVQPPAILGNIRSYDINDGIQKRHGLGKHGRNFLTALVSHLAQTCVGIGVDIQCAANDVHGERIVTKGRFVEVSGNLWPARADAGYSPNNVAGDPCDSSLWSSALSWLRADPIRQLLPWLHGPVPRCGA